MPGNESRKKRMKIYIKYYDSDDDNKEEVLPIHILLETVVAFVILFFCAVLNMYEKKPRN